MKKNRTKYLKWAESVRKPYCEIGQWCNDKTLGAMFYLEKYPHHIIFKSQAPNMIYVVENGIQPCNRCHTFAHRHKQKFYDWFQDKYPEWWNELQQLYRELHK